MWGGIEVGHSILSVESQDPLVVLASFLLECVHSLECKDGDCVRWVVISTAAITKAVLAPLMKG